VYVTSGNSLTPSATVTIADPDGKKWTDAAVGVGAVDAVFKAIERIVQTPVPTAHPSPPSSLARARALSL
jgi:2-isopropylmalate synthase